MTEDEDKPDRGRRPTAGIPPSLELAWGLRDPGRADPSAG